MNQPNSKPSMMRVAVVSASRNQREHLKRLIEEHGPKVVGISGFRDYNATIGAQKPDVLLIDLDQADDSSLDRMERLVEQSKIPILFNESTAIPMSPGPYRDDWVDNLVGKLYSLAQTRSVADMPTLLGRPRYTGGTARLALPKVLIITHSKTRRRVLQIILAEQAIKETDTADYRAVFNRDMLKKYDAVLLDHHNVGPEDATTFDQLLSQKDVPVQLCNSSQIPPAALERTSWGAKLAGQLIKIGKMTGKQAEASFVKNEILEAQHERMPISAATRNVTVAKKAASLQKDQTDLKYRPPNRTNTSAAPKITIAANDTLKNSPLASIPNKRTAQPALRPVAAAKPAAAPRDVVDATSTGPVIINNGRGKNANVVSQEERDSEISRFFNFDTGPNELAISEENQYQNKSGTVATPKKAAPGTRKISSSLGNLKKTDKKSLKTWFRSLAGIRTRLPKLFN